MGAVRTALEGPLPTSKTIVQGQVALIFHPSYCTFEKQKLNFTSLQEFWSLWGVNPSLTRVPRLEWLWSWWEAPGHLKSSHTLLSGMCSHSKHSYCVHHPGPSRRKAWPWWITDPEKPGAGRSLSPQEGRKMGATLATPHIPKGVRRLGWGVRARSSWTRAASDPSLGNDVSFEQRR